MPRERYFFLRGFALAFSLEAFKTPLQGKKGGICVSLMVPKYAKGFTYI